jgi:hypothetical protein
MTGLMTEPRAMSNQEMEPHSLWLEFEGPEGDCERSEAYAYVRLLEASIVGGAQQALICSLADGQWRLASDPGLGIARISGVGVFSVHLEQLDGSDVALPCSRIQIEGRQLQVDGQLVAQLDVARGVWTRTADARRLHGIRLEPDSGGATLLFACLPQRRSSASSAGA